MATKKKAAKKPARKAMHATGASDHIAESLRPLAYPVAQLKPDKHNARVHSDRNVEAVRASMQRWGCRSVIVARTNGTIVAGHCRYEAAQALGWATLPVLFVKEDAAESAAFAIADNRTAELAGWDNTRLHALLSSLNEAEALDLGWSMEEVQRLVESGLPEPFPEPEQQASTADHGAADGNAGEARGKLYSFYFSEPEHRKFERAVTKLQAADPDPNISATCLAALISHAHEVTK